MIYQITLDFFKKSKSLSGKKDNTHIQTQKFSVITSKSGLWWMLRLRIHAGWDLQKWLWKISSQCGFCVCNMHPCWLLAWTKQPQSSQIYYSCFVVKNTHMHYGPTPTFWHSDTLISKPPCTSQYPTLGQFCCSCKRRCKKISHCIMETGVCSCIGDLGNQLLLQYVHMCVCVWVRG